MQRDSFARFEQHLDRAILAIVFLSVLLVGCKRDATAPTLTPEPSLTAISGGLTPTATAPTATATPTKTATIAAPTSTPSPQPTATPTLTPTPRAVVFAVIGDYGLAGTPESEVAALVHSWNPDLIITTGDNNYPSGAAKTIDDNIGQYYADYIHPYHGAYGQNASSDENRFFPALGNHDYGTGTIEPYLDYFTLPGNERYYDFEQWPVHFFALNNTWTEPDGVRADSLQAQWLQAALSEATAPWKVVFMHAPPYSSGYHGPNLVSRWPYAEWGASTVLAGHDHSYERLTVDGIPYFVNGVGGYPAIYSFEEIDPASQLRFNQDYGAMRVEATESTLMFEFVTRDGVVVDRYTLPDGS